MAMIAADHPAATFVDLYATYPRFDIDVDVEQERLLGHDIILFQHPLFWYSVPSLVKEWIDLVLEHGFAFGLGGDKLNNKYWMHALSAAGPKDAYTPSGYQHYPMRTFLTPFEQTARLCHMQFLAPYILYSSLTCDEKNEIADHVEGYRTLLDALCNDSFDTEKAASHDLMTSATLSSFIR